jgi:5-formyltetrahydrofolate cyclo-ligase
VTADSAEIKAALRERFHAARLALSEAESAQRSAAICARILALPEIEGAKTVHVYWPLVHRREVDTRPLIRHLHGRGHRVVLPVVATTPGAPELGHVVFIGEENLRANPWGILEPEGPAVPTSEIDAVVVPAFGAGRNGHRIGHGWGYYDAFLTGLDAVTIGAVYAACLVATIPAEAHDVPLDIVVTENEVIRPPRP